MMTTDATGSDIVVGAEYGYTKSQNGITWVIRGKAVAADKGKVTLDNIVSKRYAFIGTGTPDLCEVAKGDRKRTIGSVQCFRINEAQKLKADLKELLDMDVPTNFENYSEKLYRELTY